LVDVVDRCCFRNRCCAFCSRRRFARADTAGTVHFAGGNRLLQGLPGNQKLVALDTRPATGEVYTVGVGSSASHLYKINLETGALSVVGSALDPKVTSSSNTAFGFDFNPTIDRVRLVSDEDQNLVLNPDTGAVTAAVPLFYGLNDPNFGKNANVVDIAYDNNIAGAVTTQQRGIDSTQNTLVTVANNLGELTTIGALGVDVQEVGGFDVSASGTAYATLSTSFFSFTLQQLYTINLVTGEASPVGFAAFGLLGLDGLTTIPDAIAE
jgi:hypothetical protein